MVLCQHTARRADVQMTTTWQQYESLVVAIIVALVVD